MKTFAARVLVVASAVSSLTSAPALAAVKVQSPAYSPWAVLSATASQTSAQAFCGVAGAAAASAAVQAAQGCVLPAVDAPVPLTAEQVAPVATVPSALTGGIGVLPLLAALGAIAGVAALLLSSGNGTSQIDVGQQQPVSP
jgi:hypothetical protein